MKTCAFVLLILFWGCGQTKSQNDWRVKVAGGTLDLHALPKFDEFHVHHAKKQDVPGSRIARVYQLVLRENIFTNGFSFKHAKMETPLWDPLYTVASFQSSSPALQGYTFEFQAVGRLPRETFDFSNGKELWLRPIDTNQQGEIRLQIVAIEGLPSLGVIVPDQ